MFKKVFSFIRKKKIFLFIILLLLGGIFAGRKLTAPKTPQYETAKVRKKDLTLTVSASGEIKSDEEASLRFQTSGQLAWVGVKKWDKVKKWQAIAALDRRELEKTLKKELIDYMNERWDYEEVTRDTYKDQVITDTIKRVMEKGGFDMERSVLDVEIADIALKYATLISPIDGIVTNVEAPYAGVNITPATAEFIISNPEKLVFSVNVDEADIGQIKEGQKAEIVLDAYPDEEITSHVEQVEFTATSTSGGGTAFVVKFKLPPNTPDEKFKLGMNGDIEIIIEEKKEVLTLPIEAIKQKEGKKVVGLLEEDKVKEIEVETGLETETEVEITRGLEKGQKVITGEKKKK